MTISRQPEQFATEAPVPVLNPERYLLARMLQAAHDDALKTSNGKPTEHALDARRWIMRDVQASDAEWEWKGSFNWCCHWLDRSATQREELRRRWLEEIAAEWRRARLQARPPRVQIRVRVPKVHAGVLVAQGQMQFCFA
jgi:hypothetical protein